MLDKIKGLFKEEIAYHGTTDDIAEFRPINSLWH
jgi:hypothetical protein